MGQFSGKIVPASPGGTQADEVCGHCGAVHAERPRPIIKRGALTLRTDPIEIWWNDSLVPLSPLEAGLMEPLMRRGRIAWDELEARLGISVETRVTLMHRIRHKFRVLGADDPLQTVRYWGLRLRVQPDARQSRAVWIGADESHEAFILARPTQFRDGPSASQR